VRQSDGSKICDKSCPDNTIFLTQNTHPAGDKTDCAHGSFIAVCCNDLQVLTSVCKNQYSADYIFSGGLSGAGGSDFHFTRGGLKERSLSARGTHLKARAEEVKSGIRKEQPDVLVALGMEHVWRIVLFIVLLELRSISLPASVVGAKPRTY
jgi:hypothetical protein